MTTRTVRRIPFDPDCSLIVVRARLWGPNGQSDDLRLVLDTGASLTLIVPELIDRLGYNPREGIARTTITSALGQEPGYTIRVARFSALGFSVPDFVIHAHDLADHAGIDGLLGLDFLRRFNYEIRSLDGVLVVEPALAA